MSARKVILEFKEETVAKKFRKEIGLRTIKSGHRCCLKCGRNFFSTDLAQNKLCVSCNETNRRYDNSLL